MKNHRLADICYVRQKEQKGLGDTIKCNNNIGYEPFAVLLDHSITKSRIPCTKQLIDVYNKYKASTVTLTKNPKR